MPKLPPEGKRPKPRRTLGMDERPPMKQFRRGILREWPATHAWSDGAGTMRTHQGTGADCREPECVAWRAEQEKPLPPPWGWPERPAPAPAGEMDEPDDDDRPDPLAPCPLTGRPHRWRWADDGNGHSGDVCACGSFEE